MSDVIIKNILKYQHENSNLLKTFFNGQSCKYLVIEINCIALICLLYFLFEKLT